jgi:hypothetical protein
MRSRFKAESAPDVARGVCQAGSMTGGSACLLSNGIRILV